jgi:hypothetical protein
VYIEFGNYSLNDALILNRSKHIQNAMGIELNQEKHLVSDRDNMRKIALDSMIGIIPNTGDSVKEIRLIREKISKEIRSPTYLEDMNSLFD